MSIYKKKDDIFFSVVTTVRNGGPFLLKMLESVKNQTFIEFEHIVLDDGSTDSTLSLLEQFQAENPLYNLRVFRSQRMGRGRALNFAVSQAKAKWIAIIDADDVWHPRKLEIQNKVLAQENLDVLSTGSSLFQHDDEICWSRNLDSFEILYFRIKDLLRSNKISHSSVVIKKEVCFYDDRRKSQFDYDLWLRLAEKCRTLAKVNVVLTYHRIHENQSFERKMKKVYCWRSYRLKAAKCIENRDLVSLGYNTIKFAFDLVFSREAKLNIYKRIQKSR